MFLTREDTEAIRKRITQDSDTKAHLTTLADQAMLEGPWSVTDDRAPSSKGGSHDYYSEGPYWWPNPEAPDGPYIRKDGLFNPAQFKQHKMALRHMCKNVLILAGAGYHLKKQSYSDYAISLIRTWFINEATAMTPHLQYGQSIPGICDGRGIGLIDTIYFVELLQGVSYLDLNGGYAKEIESMRGWFTDFMTRFCESDYGIEEKSNGNNHATWWTLQAMCYGKFVGDQGKFQMALTWYKKTILPEQMAEDGAFPVELARTRSYHYTLFNLIPIAMICELAIMQGEDLWHYELADGRGFVLGYDFLLPYLEQPATWHYPSLDAIDVEDSILLLLVEKRLKDERTKVLRRKLRDQRVLQDETMTKMMLPLCLWLEG